MNLSEKNEREEIMTKTIVAIGGGEIGEGETLPIDEYIVSLAGMVRPKLLFIPTASNDAPEYIKKVTKIYGEQLGCEVDTLCLITAPPSLEAIKEKILTANIIYVGGGNTAKLMGFWRRYQVDKFLKEAYVTGTILAGISAGAICWFEYGYSDSFKEETGEFVIVEGLGVFPMVCCPHYESRPMFDDYMATATDMRAIAIEDHCAMVFQDNAYGVLRSREGAQAYLILNEQDVVHKQPF